MIHAFSRIALVAALSLAAGPLMAQSESGQDKAADSDWVSQTTQTCASCHGKNGVAQTPNFPIIAGQYQDYLLHSLKAYRDGERENAVMAGQVQNMSNDQLEALARYYSRQTDTPLHTPYLDD
ncbi:cytochrome C [Salinisphaera orenii MK-B5]|uniref:Cytochrome C n=2 Tax=Salinisphaera orenii TaxID=856731 RepID=A0A423PSF5_9GAMM|nr:MULTISPECIES: cytochrome c [Salinisphaera]ROO28535.1 cytochrome C [Salinisphaera orenii MK-B5]ROO30913.1 cytochrome C [Salinisphaera halophila YIM 95161]